MTKSEFRAWVVEAARTMPALRQGERHMAIAVQMQHHDAELALLYRGWALQQMAIERRVCELAGIDGEVKP